jgi:hypothetical protein
MVATVSKRVQIVLGTSAAVNPKRLTAAEWIEIVRAALSELPMEYLHGLKSAKQIMNYSGSEDYLPRICPEEVLSTVLLTARNTMFAVCGSLTRGPWDRTYHPSLESKPVDHDIDPDTERLLLLNRNRDEKGSLFVLESGWIAVDKNTDAAHPFHHYKALSASMRPIELEEVFSGSAECEKIGMRILRSIHSLQYATTEHFTRRQRESARKLDLFK